MNKKDEQFVERVGRLSAFLQQTKRRVLAGQHTLHPLI